MNDVIPSGDVRVFAKSPLTVEKYVDDYLAGKGRGDTPEDRIYQQFAANNAAAIEREFQRRSSAPAASTHVRVACDLS